jgi:hypothetical protein
VKSGHVNSTENTLTAREVLLQILSTLGTRRRKFEFLGDGAGLSVSKRYLFAKRSEKPRSNAISGIYEYQQLPPG